MVYIFNTLSHRIVTSVGGGTVYLSGSWGAKESAEQAVEELNKFLTAHPEGGDVTQIVTDHQARMRVKREEERTS
jgi:hypothetical protein